MRRINPFPSVGIHAISRLAHAKRAVELLLADDPQEAQRVALEANGLNQKRQAMQERIYLSALAQIEEHAWTRRDAVSR